MRAAARAVGVNEKSAYNWLRGTGLTMQRGMNAGRTIGAARFQMDLSDCGRQRLIGNGAR